MCVKMGSLARAGPKLTGGFQGSHPSVLCRTLSRGRTSLGSVCLIFGCLTHYVSPLCLCLFLSLTDGTLSLSMRLCIRACAYAYVTHCVYVYMDVCVCVCVVLFSFAGMLGGRATKLATGGAPIADKPLAWARRLFGDLKVVYGATECGGISTDNVINDSVEVRLRDVPEYGYCLTDKPYPRGEILVRSDATALGYYGDSVESVRASASFLEGGWYATGDVGVQEANGRVRIIDRIKACFKLRIGEFVSPAKLEMVFLACKFLQSCAVYGDQNHDHLILLGVVDSAALDAFVLEFQKGDEKPAVSAAEARAQAAKDPELASRVLADVQNLGRAKQLRPHELPRAVVLSAEPWTPDNGLLTPSRKLARRAIKRAFRAGINSAFLTLEEAPILTPDKIRPSLVRSHSLSAFDHVTSIAQEVLGVVGANINLNLSFAELGGSSMQVRNLLFPPLASEYGFCF